MGAWRIPGPSVWATAIAMAGAVSAQDVGSGRPGPAAGLEVGAVRPERASGIHLTESRSGLLSNSAASLRDAFQSLPGPSDLLGLLASGAVPTLPATVHWLSDAEVRDVRDALGFGIATAVPREGEFKYHPVLVIPPGVKASHVRKPRATIRVLLQVVTDGRAERALLAAGCVAALTENISVGAMYVMYPPDQLDAKRPTGETRREQLLQVLGKMIAEREERESRQRWKP